MLRRGSKGRLLCLYKAARPRGQGTHTHTPTLQSRFRPQGEGTHAAVTMLIAREGSHRRHAWQKHGGGASTVRRDRIGFGYVWFTLTPNHPHNEYTITKNLYRGRQQALTEIVFTTSEPSSWLITTLTEAVSMPASINQLKKSKKEHLVDLSG